MAMDPSRPAMIYILPYLELGGTERHVLTLARQVMPGRQPVLVAPPGPGLQPFLEMGILHLPFPRLESHPVRGVAELRRRIKEAVTTYPHALLHIHAAHELTLLARTVTRRHPLLFTVHGYATKMDYWTCSRLCNRFADRVICVAESERRILLSMGLEKKKLVLIPNGVEPHPTTAADRLEVRSELGIHPDSVAIGAAVRLEPGKGLLHLVGATARLKQRLPGRRIQLVIAGEGSQRGELEAAAQANGMRLGEDVVFLGYRPDVRRLLGAFDIYTLPSLHEAMPLGCLEAMAAGLPVVGTRVGGIGEIVKASETGLLVEPRDVDGLEAALETLVTNEELRRTMGLAGQRRFLAEFTASVMAERTERIYRELTLAY